MKKYVKNAVKSALSKPLRGRYRRFISIGVSALLSISTFLTAIPQTQTTVYAADTVKKLQLGYAVIGVNANTNSAATVYFGSKGDPLAWRVIGYKESGVASPANTATLLASDNIGSSEFDDTSPYSHVYAGSKLQSAVNNIYTNRFTSIEDSNILSRKLSVGGYSGAVPYTDGVATTEVSDAKLWPLSTYEAKNTNSDLRIASAFWWLRSPGVDDDDAASVFDYGIVRYDGNRVNGNGGVRPAFNINLPSIILTSAAVDGKDAGSTTGTLKEIADYSGSDWKLTILDSSRNGFAVSAGTGATLSKPVGYTSWTVPVTYSGAPSGTNEHVSAILTDKDGVALYYGHIDHEVTIPTGLSGGTYYLKVFSEQCNGNNKTDLASPMSTIELKVKAKYDLEFDKNGGSGTMTSTEVYDGDTYTFPECGFTAPDDKTFYYWEMSGVDGEYQPEDGVQISDNCATNGKITVKAHWKDANKAVVKTEPEGKALKYNGSEQELVSAGEAENGTMHYAIGDDDTTAPTSGWSETVPRRKDKGTYYVWYKAKGTGEYADSDPGCTTATISDKDPVKVEKVELSDDKLTLSPGESEQITATIFPKNAADQTVSWKVGDESIIKITSDGKVCTVTAVATGETVVTVTTEDGGKEAVCTVIVEEEPNPKPDKCKISFAANGGEGEMKDQTVDKGVKTQLNANTFTRDGYTFDSWNTQADGKGKSYDDKDYITVEKDITVYAQWEKGKPRPTPRKHDDDEEEIVEESKPAVVNPDTVEGYFATNGQLLPGVTMGKTKQGVAAQAIFNASRPAGWQEAFTFNMAINGKVDYALKNGVLTIIIPKEFQKAGRTFAIMALDKNGRAWVYADTDTNPNTVTATINVEGYAFALIYKD